MVPNISSWSERISYEVICFDKGWHFIHLQKNAVVCASAAPHDLLIDKWSTHCGKEWLKAPWKGAPSINQWILKVGLHTKKPKETNWTGHSSSELTLGHMGGGSPLEERNESMFWKFCNVYQTPGGNSVLPDSRCLEQSIKHKTIPIYISQIHAYLLALL